MLTLAQLEAMPPHTIFAEGIVENSPEEIYMTSHRVGGKMRWIAKRGEIADWTIYMAWEEYDAEYVSKYGDKPPRDKIKYLVPCETDAFNMYRK